MAANEHGTRAPPRETLDELLQRELFERLPFSLTVIDPELNVVRANSHFEAYFGDWRGRKCYQVYRDRRDVCSACPALLTFRDGHARVADETGRERDGRISHYVTHLAPLADRAGNVRYVVQMTRDVTETSRFQREHDILFDRVPCYITVINRNFRIIRTNEKFRDTFGRGRGGFCYQYYKRRAEPCERCPAALTFADGAEHVAEMVGVTTGGDEAWYVVTTAPLSRGRRGVEHVIEIAADVTDVKKLENEKLEAERLAAVGQTVAGLAHTIKNLLMGLEGGMYMVDTGLKRDDRGRISRGWDVLQRNFDKTTMLVREFLSFAKGRVPELTPVDPARVLRDIHDFYADTAREQGVELTVDADPGIEPLPLDPDGIEACLTNLLSNGIDAALLRERGGGKVVMRAREQDGEVSFEVEDNGVGIAPEIKHKIFTTFFTTKGGGGTGLGLLTTRKIVQEHGGEIEMESTPGEGSTFRITLYRSRLNKLAREEVRDRDGRKG
ncbi:MAG: Signal transduction histidine-protein kinase AtoS [Calditrichaeota bacterium]|nr:Signal transduction histidine-protein kinase AtoS [Calditrichota bacterium]